MATKRNIRMKNWNTSHLKVHVLVHILNLVRRPYFQFFNVARGYVEEIGKPGDEAKYFCTQDYNCQYTVWAYSELMFFTQSALCFLVKIVTIVSLNYLPFSCVELLYDGFWEHEHHTSTPSHPSPPLQGHTHYSTSRHHTFALTFVLGKSSQS